MISSQNNLLFSYILYLIGKTEYGIDEFRLRQTVSRWFFMSSLTGRFTGSPESDMEFDLAQLRDVEDADGFLNKLDAVSDQVLTSDFWSITLPSDLATSSPRSPSLFAYHASLVLLGARALFSKLEVSELLDPTTQANRSPVERHHLFPKAHLKELGVSEQRERNQIANYALVEWGDNNDISSQSPAEYLPPLKDRFSPAELEKMFRWHALPDGWEEMEYREFLVQRRELIAGVIRDAYEGLKSGGTLVDDTEAVPVEDLIHSGESSDVEFKSTLRINLHTNVADPRMELGCLKTIAGFLNANGGVLIVGVTDDAESLGICADKFPNEDKMNLHLVNLMRDRIGPQFMAYVHPRFEDYDGARILVVECRKSKSPVFVRDGKQEHFFIRTGAATTELSASQTQDYIKHRFGS